MVHGYLKTNHKTHIVQYAMRCTWRHVLSTMWCVSKSYVISNNWSVICGMTLSLLTAAGSTINLTPSTLSRHVYRDYFVAYHTQFAIVMS